jgi:MATE family multidrug resistance protein
MNKEIIRLAIPNIISNLTVPILGMVDLALLGHLESEIYIGAIALGGMIFNIIYWGFGFLRMGTSGFTAQAYGKGDEREVMLVLGRAGFVALSGGILILILQYPIALLSFWIMDGSREVEVLAREYFFIRVFAAPATIILYAFSGWFLGMQNAKYPMIIAIVVNVLNVAFNFYFVYGLDMKHEGVALGTVLAQYSGLILAIALFLKKYKRYLEHLQIKAMMKVKAMKEFFLVNSDIVVRTLLLLFVFSFFTNQSAKISNEILAINTLLLQYLFIFSYFIDGFANASEALAGKYYGAGNKNELKKVISMIFLWGIYISIPFTLVYLIAGKNLLYILTDQADIIENAASYLLWIALVPLITFAAFIWDGVYIGATATKAMRNAMIVSTLIVFLPAYYLLINSLGNHGLWFAMMLFMASRGILLTLLYRRSILSKV